MILFSIKNDSKLGFINEVGDEIIKCQFGKYPSLSSRNSWFSEGLAMVRFGKKTDVGILI